MVLLWKQGSDGFPIILSGLDRPHWPRKQCEGCGNGIVREYIHLDALGQSWADMVPDKDPSTGVIGLCEKCFRVARTAEGRIMGYKFRNGKIKQHVVEELFGGEIA